MQIYMVAALKTKSMHAAYESHNTVLQPICSKLYASLHAVISS